MGFELSSDNSLRILDRKGRLEKIWSRLGFFTIGVISRSLRVGGTRPVDKEALITLVTSVGRRALTREEGIWSRAPVEDFMLVIMVDR